MGILQTKLISSLEKVFPDEEPQAPERARGSALRNERFSFQLAYRWRGPETTGVAVKAESPLNISVREVGLVPSGLPCYPDRDAFVLRASPGPYPDPLLPPGEEGLTLKDGPWRSLWVSADGDGGCGAGVFPIDLSFTSASGGLLAERRFTLEIVDAELPAQTLKHTEWLHTDCILDRYGTDVFSEKYWDLVGRYLKTYAEYGMNMLLTPLFTPPLDTREGGERPTVQLVDVTKRGGGYEFGFSRLDRWLSLMEKCGIPYVEFPHLFTQWGAKHAPKIMGIENGVEKRLFGWETDASGEEYGSFLKSFLPALRAYADRKGISGRCSYHISDEPDAEGIESYRRARSLVERPLTGCSVMDALSDYDYYREGLVDIPVCATSAAGRFLHEKVPRLWAYYCCNQYRNGLSNRFFCMPGLRTRVLGVQLYRLGVEGFLHWGFNFWNTRLSVSSVDPYRVTDAGGAYPSGDAFVVYPGGDGPVVSLRLELLNEGMQDARALALLERKIGRDAVIRLLERGGPLTFESYPHEAGWLLDLREEINRGVARRS